MNVTNDDEFFELEKVYPYLKDKKLSIEISKLVGLGNEDNYKIGKDMVNSGLILDTIKLEQKVYKKKLKYEHNDFYIYITPKIMTLLDLKYEIGELVMPDITSSSFDWEYLCKELRSFNLRYDLNNYIISKEDRFLSINLMLTHPIPPLSLTNPCLYVV